MTDAKDPLEELRSIEQDMNERAETGNSDMDDYRHWAGVRDGLAAWEKERAELDKCRAVIDRITNNMVAREHIHVALRAAVESIVTNIDDGDSSRLRGYRDALSRALWGE